MSGGGSGGEFVKEEKESVFLRRRLQTVIPSRFLNFTFYRVSLRRVFVVESVEERFLQQFDISFSLLDFRRKLEELLKNCGWEGD